MNHNEPIVKKPYYEPCTSDSSFWLCPPVEHSIIVKCTQKKRSTKRQRHHDVKSATLLCVVPVSPAVCESGLNYLSLAFAVCLVRVLELRGPYAPPKSALQVSRNRVLRAVAGVSSSSLGDLIVNLRQVRSAHQVIHLLLTPDWRKEAKENKSRWCRRDCEWTLQQQQLADWFWEEANVADSNLCFATWHSER